MPFSLLGGRQVRAACPLAGLPAEPEWCLSATSRVSHSAGDTEWWQATGTGRKKRSSQGSDHETHFNYFKNT